MCMMSLSCVCVLHIKPLFLPVDIKHNQCPCRFFNPRRDTYLPGTSYYVVTKLRHRDTTLPRMNTTYAGSTVSSGQYNAMLDTTDTTYTLYEIEKRKEDNQIENKKNEDKSKEKKKKKSTRYDENVLYCPLFLLQDKSPYAIRITQDNSPYAIRRIEESARALIVPGVNR